MNLTKPIRPEYSLQSIVQIWKDQIICLSPKGEGYSAYLVNARCGSLINYIHANCDELRHSATNYDSLLVKIKEQHEGHLKEVILNTIKYETTRRSFKKQHEWIQNSYKKLIEYKQLNIEQQSAEIKQLKQIISEQQQEVTNLKSECRGQLAAIKATRLLKLKEVEIAQKNSQIAQLNQQLQQSDREINKLKSELNNGMNQLKLKYKWLITQFIQDRTEQEKIDHNNKSLQSCQNIFKKAQRKINLLQAENKFLRQENLDLYNQAKMLRV
jgi:predicted RNase H-like nuclease (RuvC/YqgF family)